MSKAQKTKPGAASSDIQDIAHEEVKHENGISLIPKVVTAEEQLKNEIAKFNIADSAIEQMKKQFSGLTISGPEDKEGYKKTREAWGEVRSTRTKLEKKGLELRNGYGVITKGIKKEEDRLIELLSPLEEQLYKSWKEIDDLKEKAKAEALAAEEAILNARLDLLVGLGMQFVSGMWQIGETISIDVATLRAMTDDQFEAMKRAVKAKADEIETERLIAENNRKIEAERLQAEKDELLMQQAEMKKEREEMQRQKDELAQQQREAAKLKLDNRKNQLFGLGMIERADMFVFDNGFSQIKIGYVYLDTSGDSDWNKKVIEIKSAIDQSNLAKSDHENKVNQEKREKAEKEKMIAEVMEKAGMPYNYNLQAFMWGNKVKSFSAQMSQLLEMPEAEIRDLGQRLGAERLAAIKQQDADEKEQQESAAKAEKMAMTDSEQYDRQILSLIVVIGSIDIKGYKTKKFNDRAKTLRDKLTVVINELQ